ncbi:acyl-CoA thioesterase, partial [Halofilum ochraceum]|uniref:acyl-CoA thioesterase n=1 Tax=Halofilum ochraceum TaxID=1611323 RepID=UPI0011131D30
MKYRTRKMVAAKDLNSNGALFGGRVLAWIDEEAFIYAACQLESTSVVTRSISDVHFLAGARQGDIVEIGTGVVEFGRTSITIECEVRNRRTRQSITRVDRLVFVRVDGEGEPKAHGVTPGEPARSDTATGGNTADRADQDAVAP